MAEKNKHTVWIGDEVWEKASARYEEYNFRSVSELIDQAVEFYLSYRAAGESEIYLSEALTQMLRSMIKLSEDRISRLLFKIAVEDAVMKNVLAAGFQISPEQVEELRGQCVQEVRKLNGILALKDAAGYQSEAD
ncbi:MAG: hypothetical protein Q4C48_06795 [Lachnospiraceae bacterium]|nr:hypothetical protein [Lachnospiraceae bacterium]